MKRILIVIPELTYSGSMFSSKRICKVLDECGFEVEVWSYREGPFKREFDAIGVATRIIDENNVYGNEKLTEELQSYDLIIANTIIVYAIADVAKNIVPTIWYIREAQNLSMFFVHDIMSYYALKRAENIYCVSEYAKSYIASKYNSNVRVVHNCVEDEAVGYLKARTDGKIRFWASGTLEERKAFGVLLHAYSMLDDRYKKQCEVHFAGRLPESSKWYAVNFLKELEKEDGAFYHGEIQERKRLLQLMADSDVIVVPSRDESCSLVALEAVMLSKPLIVSKNVGAQYIVREDNGWIFETDNIADLSSVLCDAVDKKEKLSDMGMCSRRMYLETSTYEAYKKNIYEMVLNNMTDDIGKYRNEHLSRAADEDTQRQKELKKNMPCRFANADNLEGKQIAIYAAGQAGKAFYHWSSAKCKVICWVDKMWNQYDEKYGIKSIDSLKSVEVDYVYIAVQSRMLAEDIKKELVEMGIAKDKLVWTYPVFD